MLAEQGWGTAQSQNIAFAYGSTAVTFPKRWFPAELFRFYKPPGGIDRLAFASLLLDDDPEGNYALSEPLASAGVLYFREDQDPSYEVTQYWWARFHGYAQPSWGDHGTYCVFRPHEAWRNHVAKRPEWYPFHLVKTVAVPLADCTSEVVVRERVLQPLVHLLTAPP